MRARVRVSGSVATLVILAAVATSACGPSKSRAAPAVRSATPMQINFPTDYSPRGGLPGDGPRPNDASREPPAPAPREAHPGNEDLWRPAADPAIPSPLDRDREPPPPAGGGDCPSCR